MKLGLKYFLLSVIIIFGGVLPVHAQKPVVGYYPYWSKGTYPADKIDYENLTYIIHSYISPGEDGSISLSETILYPELLQKAHLAGVKVLICLAGADSISSSAFVKVASNPEIKTKFINNLVGFVNQNGYDGVDIDWEFPSNENEKTALTTLVKEIRSAFNAMNRVMFLTMAVNPNDAHGQFFDFENFIDDLNWVSMMGYDFRGSWNEYAGHNAPLFSNPDDPENNGSDSDGINYLIETRNIPKEKIFLGVPFYGKEFYASGLFKKQYGATDLIYSDIYQRLINPEWNYFWDDTSKVPYLINTNHDRFITFDDTTSIRIKCEYVKENNLAGIMIWALGYDYINGESQLLKTVGKSLGLTTGIQISGNNSEVSPRYKLFDNYPNPFNPSTRISYQLSIAGYVTLKIYDVLGRELTTLVDDLQQPGNYSVQLSTFDYPLSSGIYFFTLRVSDSSLRSELYKTKKMILMK